MITPLDIRGPSVLGPDWSALYTLPVAFPRLCFDAAMDNILRNPNINSTVLLRADIYFECVDGAIHSNNLLESSLDPSWLRINIADNKPRVLDIPGYTLTSYLVRRNVPRNPTRDPIVNQTCALYTNALNSDRLAVYIPHCAPEDCPFYLPKVRAVAILYTGALPPLIAESQCSVHYLLDQTVEELAVPLLQRGPSDRLVRIGLHLLNTSVKHSRGVMDGYRKRVAHDLVVDRNAFQNTYLLLKRKYAAELLANWQEKTDPRKHVFEDLGIAAFLIELWHQMYANKTDFEFLDLGCGNGLLVFVLLSEGYTGRGIDARERKSWSSYPPYAQKALKSSILVPKLLDPKLNESTGITLVGGAPDLEPTSKPVFYIGNHSDELTLWLPLLSHPFMVIPCCSHNLSGSRTRYATKGGAQKSTYAALVEKTVEIATLAGWKVEIEALRIPSTRNTAIIGRKCLFEPDLRDIVQREGGAELWLENAQRLLKSKGDH